MSVEKGYVGGYDERRDRPPDLRSDERKAIDGMRDRAVASERERCAGIADRQAGQLRNGGAINACRAIAAAIRAYK